MKVLFAVYNKKSGELTPRDESIIVVENDAYRTAICGQIYDMTPGDVSGHIVSLGAKAVERINGQYIIYHYDKAKKELIIIHDRTTSPLNLYYTSSGDSVFISTSLKKLLSESKIGRTLNKLAAEEFLINGFTNNKYTLIENVFKLEAFKALKIGKDGIDYIPVTYPVADISVEEAKAQWRPTLDHAIEKRFSGEDEICGTISGGFDSNYILWSAKQQSDKHARVFSVGGAKGKNEVPTVEENMKNYDNVTLTTRLTDDDTLEYFPEIVWRLEGGVYENGIFLQYVLNKMLRENGVKYLLCGEVADQVMNPGYWNEDIIYPEDAQPDNIKFYEFSQYPFMYGHYVILKKNGILSNTFDVEGRYPFLDSEFLPAAKALKELNGKTKEYHKKVCRGLLPKGIVDNMQKVGGSTDVRSMFRDRKQIKSFIKYVEKTDTFREFNKYFSIDPSLLPQTAREKFDHFIKRILCKLFGFRKESIKANDEFIEEMKLRSYILCINLQLFRDLFISGKYDGGFDSETFDKKLSEII